MSGSPNKITPVKLYFAESTPEGWDKNLAPIIFIPGLVSSNSTFCGVRYKISRKTKRKMYSIDLRNHGKSGSSKYFTIPHLVADLEQFMEEENIPIAVLAGHSVGGKVALAFALKNPEKVEKLVVEDIPLRASKAQNEQLLRSLSTLQLLHSKLKELPPELTDKQAQQILVPYVVKAFPRAVNNFIKAKSNILLPFWKNKEGKFEWALDIESLLDLPNHFEDLDIDLSSDPKFYGETLLMAGEKSIIRVQDNLEDFYKHFPNLECRIIENGFHTYHVEFPELYIKLVTKLID